ncbi:DUF6344 domain-containing protein [Streptomyces sp. NPDC047002]|uniref:DUF6344 domain-containing protein n=1 Tax=Streptomyces sp. NPDC047002 TaxID=3155475 RepID=UPI003455E994
MAVVKVRNLWTAFITAFFAVLATLGLTAPANAARSVAQPADQPAGRGAETVAPAPAAPVPVPAPRAGTSGTAAASTGAAAARNRAPEPAAAEAAPRERALPPTIKQRITAEAHGSSPSVRRIPAEQPLDSGIAGLGDVALAAA